MPVRPSDIPSKFDGLDRWPLMSVQFWGESSVGEWRIIIDNKEGIRRFSPWKSQQDILEKASGHWESIYMVVYGTETFPIRLRPPNKERPPPKVLLINKFCAFEDSPPYC